MDSVDEKCKNCFWYSEWCEMCEYELGEHFKVKPEDDCHIHYTKAFEENF